MARILECLHPDCSRTFIRVTCQKYCSVECRKADRRCPTCKAHLPLDQPGTKNSYCRPCGAEIARLRRGTPEERVRSVGAFRLKQYGITADEYVALCLAQDDRCAICGQPETGFRRGQVRTLSVDHDHDTGRIRGLLCFRCNSALGLMADDPDRLAAAIRYLSPT